MGIGYTGSHEEPHGVVAESLADYFAVGGSPRKYARKRNRRNKNRSKNSYRHSRRKSRGRRNHSIKSKRSRGGIKYTKHGQPYRIMANGRARFIKK